MLHTSAPTPASSAVGPPASSVIAQLQSVGEVISRCVPPPPAALYLTPMAPPSPILHQQVDKWLHCVEAAGKRALMCCGPPPPARLRLPLDVTHLRTVMGVGWPRPCMTRPRWLLMTGLRCWPRPHPCSKCHTSRLIVPLAPPASYTGSFVWAGFWVSLDRRRREGVVGQEVVPGRGAGAARPERGA